MKKYQEPYTRSKDDRGYRQDIYTRKIETYDANGTLTNVKEYATYRDREDGEESVYLRREKNYDAGALTKESFESINNKGETTRTRVTDFLSGTNQVREYSTNKKAASQEEIYQFTTPDGKKYNVANNEAGREFAQSKGIDLAKALDQQKRGTFTLVESPSGKEYEARVEKIMGKDYAVGIRPVSDSEIAARGNTPPPIVSMTTPRAAARSPIQTLTSLSIENIATKRDALTLTDASLAAIKVPGETTRTDLAQQNFLPISPAPRMLQASTEPRRYGSSSFSEQSRLNFQLANAGKPGATLAAVGAIPVAFTVGVFEFGATAGKPVLTALKTPFVLAKQGPAAAGKNLLSGGAQVGEFLVSPVLAAMNPRETLTAAAQNPSGTAGQLAAGFLAGKLIGGKSARAQEAKAKLAFEEQLSETTTPGQSVVLNEKAVFTEKTGENVVKFKDRTFSITSKSREAAGILNGEAGLIAGSDALAIARGVAGEAASGSALAGGGQTTFSILEGQKVLARGEVATQLGSVDASGAEVFARVSRTRTTFTKTGKTLMRGDVEVGVLEPMLQSETRIVPEGAKLGRMRPAEPFILREQITEGRSIQLREEGLRAKDIRIEEMGRIFETDRVQISKGSILDLSLNKKPAIFEGETRITSETATIDAARFLTSEKRGILPKPKLPTNPLEETPEFGFRQIFGDQTKTEWSLDRYLTPDQKPVFTADQLTRAPKGKEPSLSIGESMRRGEASVLLRDFEAGRLTAGQLGGRLRQLGIAPSAQSFGKASNAELRAFKTTGSETQAMAEAFGKLFAEEPRKPVLLTNSARTAEGRLEAGETLRAPVAKQSAPLDLSPRQLPEARLGAKGLTSSLPRTGLRENLNIREATMIAQKPRTEARRDVSTRIDSIPRLDQASRLNQDSATKLTDLTKLGEASKIRQGEKLITSNALKLTQRTTSITRTGTPIPPPQTLTPKTPPLSLPRSNPSQQVAGYDVLVKKKGSFLKVNPEPLSREAALAKGLRAADLSASASVKLVKSGEAMPSSASEKTGIKGLLNKFKQKKGDLFVERNIGRIDSPGEFSEITLKGLGALATKRRRK